MKIHCLFEQSGTFKDAAAKFGIEAIDYDIDNKFGRTDVQIDLFNEIHKAHIGKKSIFDSFSKDDIILAFFPCIRFEAQIGMFMRGEAHGIESWDDEKKLLNAWKLEQQRSKFYGYVVQLFLICIKRGLRLIFENPYSFDHYLTNYFPIKPKVVDKDRTLLGDKFLKPTQYWFVNCEPKNNFFLESTIYTGRTRTINNSARGIERSIITPEYAYNFLRVFVLERTDEYEQQS